MSTDNASNSGSQEQSFYILLEDKSGYIMQKSGLIPIPNAIQKLRSKTFQVLKGSLFKQMLDGNDGENTFEIKLISLDNKEHILQCFLKDVRKLNKKEASMLLPVPSHNERYEVIHVKDGQSQLSKALNAEVGDKVKVLEMGQNEPEGVLKYIGLLTTKRCKGTYFGVQFEEPLGDSDGCVEDIRYFICDKNHGIFVPIHKIEFLEKNITGNEQGTGAGKKNVADDSKEKATTTRKGSKRDKSSKLQTLKAKDLIVGTRVVYLGKDSSSKPVAGTICYVGNPNPKSYEGLVAGVVLDVKLDAAKRGLKTNGNYYAGRKIFDSKGNISVMAKANTLMKEEDYHNVKIKNQLQDYVTVNDDDSSELKKQEVKKPKVKPLDPNEDQRKIFKELEENKSISSECTSKSTQQNTGSIEKNIEFEKISKDRGPHSSISKSELVVGTRVIHFGKDNNKPMAGVIRSLKNEEAEVIASVEFDKKISSAVGINANYYDNKKLFDFNGNKATLAVKADTLIKEEDYADHKMKSQPHDDVIVDNDDLSELKKQEVKTRRKMSKEFIENKSIPSECTSKNTKQNTVCIEQHNEPEKVSHDQGLNSKSSKSELIVGTRVIYFDNDNNAMAGVIRFVGPLKNAKEIMAGVELDTKINGHEKGNYYCGKKIFTCFGNKAVIAKVDTLMKEEDYGDGKNNKSESHDYVTVNVDGSVDDNTPELKKQEVKQPQVTNLDLVEEQREILKKFEEKKFKDPPDSISKYPTQSTWNSREQNIQLEIHSQDQSISGLKSELGIDRSGPNIFYHESDNSIYQHNLHPESYNVGDPANTTQHIYHKDSSVGKQKSCEGVHIPKESKPDNEQEDKMLSDTSLQIGSMVEIKIKNKLYYGVLRWIGNDDRFPYKLAGLELENSDLPCNDGKLQGRRYFSSPLGRAFFIKARLCKPDSRFSNYSITPNVIDKPIKSLKGFILPNSMVEEGFIGRNKGIQGHHNSCYMDSTLFAMFAYSHVFDVLLNRKRRRNDIDDYDEVQKILKEQIVNPLRKYAFVDHQSVLRLREYLNQLGNIGGFLTEEKDPEEFVVLLLEKVLKVDPFIKLRLNNRDEDSHLYQIFMDRDKERKRNPLPSVQYLLEHSFLTSHLQLAEIPSVMILQMPRFGQTKLYKRIQINPMLDITPLLADMAQACVICGEVANVLCSDCAGHFGWEIVYTYLCKRCCNSVHKHTTRKNHKYIPCVAASEHSSVSMELFAVVCIEKSHYVSFVKCGVDEDENWLFFDSMADRRGGEDGYNIPEVSILYGLKEILNGNPLGISDLDKKDDEQILRFFEDSSLCFYRNRSLTMYR